MHRDVVPVRPDDHLDDAFVTMQKCIFPALPVIDADGRLVGLLTAENVGEMVIIKSLRPKQGKPSWRPAHA
jgi:stage IV sporulation protein FB